MICRLAELSDLDQLIELENRCFSTDKLNIRQYKHFIESKTATLIVVKKNRIIGAGLMLYRKNSSIARLYSIAVHPDARKKGIAKKIYRALLKDVEKRKCTEIRLEVRQDNRPAIKFYEKLKFDYFGEYKKFYEDQTDACRMRLELNKMKLK